MYTLVGAILRRSQHRCIQRLTARVLPVHVLVLERVALGGGDGSINYGEGEGGGEDQAGVAGNRERN